MEPTRTDHLDPNRIEPARTRGPLAFIVAIILLGLLFFAGLVPKLRANSQLASDAKTVGTETPEVEVVAPRLTADDALILPGNLQAITEAALQARASGYVTRLMVDIGSRVKKGQLLAEIESPDVDQQVAQASADTAKSRAGVGQSVADVARLSAGVAQSRADVVHQLANIKQAQAAVAGMRSKLAQAQADLSGSKAKLAQSEQQVKVQHANVDQAAAQYGLAEATEKRYRGLLADGFVSQQDYDQVAATLKTTAANLAAVRASEQASLADVEFAKGTVAASAAMVSSAQSDVAAAEESVHAAEATMKASLASVDAAQAGVSAGRAAVQADQAQVGSSIANERRYGVLRSFQDITAPFDGVITARNVDVGSLVTPGTNDSVDAANPTPSVGLFGIARTDILRVRVNLPQTYYRSGMTGSNADVSIREIPKRVFQGVITVRAGAIDPSTRTLLAEVHIANPNNLLLPGMYAEVKIVPSKEQASIRIPANTLLFDSEGTRVAIVKPDGRIHYQPVKVGRDFGKELEILDGLSLKDQLVANPSDDLKEGLPVRIEGK